MDEDTYEEMMELLQEVSKKSPVRLYIGSGEDFDVEMTFGSPNRLLARWEVYNNG